MPRNNSGAEPDARALHSGSAFKCWRLWGQAHHHRGRGFESRLPPGLPRV